MQIREVEYFLTVAEHGSVRHAAASLGLTQPSLSRGIVNLEREFGQQLFDRLGHGVVLTAAGKAFLGPARRLVRTARLDADPTSLSLDIAVWGTLTIDPTADLIAQLHTESPALRIRIEQADDEESVCRLVREGHCEIGMMSLPAIFVSGLRVIPAGTFQEWLVLPPGTEVEPGPLPLSAVSDYRLIVPAGGSQVPFVGMSLAAAGVDIRLGVLSAHREALISLVVAGAGATTASERYARVAASRGAVIRELVPPITREYGLVHRDDVLSPAARRFIALALADTAN
ncbi:MAG: transcriptional regulator, LysR family [Nocardia sp.]|uniref:LysR family transcriptional regulator n=1 Tax=Nocardia sp. TaxID=1821 RepID=UPI00262FFCD8|nr:LysR family transcriptional regulator [Nocardia sp.]MCU1642551.1 transcriptional regulator, LysR family [Nocardia sp.]